jgi:hypothetical protein
MKPSPYAIWLSFLTAVLAALEAIGGLFWQTEGEQFAFITVHGQTAQIYGRGVYAFDTVFTAGIFKGTDVVTLAIFIPLLIISILLYHRGSLRGAFMLTGVLAFFLYNGLSMAFSAAYNNLFLLYAALLGCSLYAFILAFTSIDLGLLAGKVSGRLPHRGMAVFLFVAGLAPLALWLGDVLGALAQGRVPVLLASYTTMFTYAIDLGVIVPTVYLAGILLLRRTSLGYMLAFVMLMLLAAVGVGVVTQTLAQTRLGIAYNTGQLIGLIGSWFILGLFAIGFCVSLLRNLSESPTPMPGTPGD